MGRPRALIQRLIVVRLSGQGTVNAMKRAPGFFEASLKPTDPLHIAATATRSRPSVVYEGAPAPKVLDRAEAHWRQNYPDGPGEDRANLTKVERFRSPDRSAEAMNWFASPRRPDRQHRVGCGGRGFRRGRCWAFGDTSSRRRVSGGVPRPTRRWQPLRPRRRSR